MYVSMCTYCTVRSTLSWYRVEYVNGPYTYIYFDAKHGTNQPNMHAAHINLCPCM